MLLIDIFVLGYFTVVLSGLGIILIKALKMRPSVVALVKALTTRDDVKIVQNELDRISIGAFEIKFGSSCIWIDGQECSDEFSLRERLAMRRALNSVFHNQLMNKLSLD